MAAKKWPWQIHGEDSFKRMPMLVEKYSMSPEETDVLKKLQLSFDEQETIMNVPQRTDAWHAARVNRLTASNFGAAAGHHGYQTHNQLLKNLLWNTFTGNSATEWGKDHEDTAAEVYMRYMEKQYPLHDIKLTFPGLLVSVEHPWAGCSPDGFVWVDGVLVRGLEIKCPFRMSLYDFIPSYYYDQIQGTMGLCHIPVWDFVVWTPTVTEISQFNFDPKYWDMVLFHEMETFYMKKYLPRVVLQQQGKLAHGKLEEEAPLELDDDVDLEAARPARKRQSRSRVSPEQPKQANPEDEPDIPEGFDFDR